MGLHSTVGMLFSKILVQESNDETNRTLNEQRITPPYYRLWLALEVSATGSTEEVEV
jgi:hypothetical protein